MRRSWPKHPFSYYGVLALTRLRELGERPALALPEWSGKPRRPPAPRPSDATAAAGRGAGRRRAGGGGGAGAGAGRVGRAVAPGRERALAVLLDRYPRLQQWRRAYQLAETHGDAALASAPRRGGPRVLGGGLPARLRRAGREVRAGRGQPRPVPLRHHAQGVGLSAHRGLVRRRPRAAADDPHDERPGWRPSWSCRSPTRSCSSPRSTCAWAPATWAGWPASSGATSPWRRAPTTAAPAR